MIYFITALLWLIFIVTVLLFIKNATRKPNTMAKPKAHYYPGLLCEVLKDDDNNGAHVEVSRTSGEFIYVTLPGGSTEYEYTEDEIEILF